jgi:hypothetical protein
VRRLTLNRSKSGAPLIKYLKLTQNAIHTPRRPALPRHTAATCRTGRGMLQVTPLQEHR